MNFPRLKWPAYKAHKKSRCYECGAPLKDHIPSGHAPGSGAYQGRCSKCPYMTWYDLEAQLPREVLASHALEEPAFNANCFFASELYYHDERKGKAP